MLKLDMAAIRESVKVGEDGEVRLATHVEPGEYEVLLFRKKDLSLPSAQDTEAQQRRSAARIELLAKHMTAAFTMLADQPEALDLLLVTIAEYDFRGKRIHDANPVTSMLIDRVPRLLTNNPQDFQRCAHLIEVVPLSAAAEAFQ
jgi:hypothetical protein